MTKRKRLTLEFTVLLGLLTGAGALLYERAVYERIPDRLKVNHSKVNYTQPGPSGKPPPLTAEGLVHLEDGVELMPEYDWSKARFLTEDYPEDPDELVLVKIDEVNVGTTALGAAIWAGDQAQIEAYLEAGADIRTPFPVKLPTDPANRSFAAHMAINAVFAEDATPDFFEMILEKGADSNATEQLFVETEDGSIMLGSKGNVLSHTVTSGIIALVEAVLERGVDVNQGSISRRGTYSPLYLAVQLRYERIAKLLVEHGADPELGFTPWSGPMKSPLTLAEEMLKPRVAMRRIDGGRSSRRRRIEPAEREKIETIIRLLRQDTAEQNINAEVSR